MKAILCIILPLLFLLGSGCQENSSDKPARDPGMVTTFYLIRHAEKDRSDPEDVDPELNQDGLGRAMHWAEILDEVPLDAIYSTDFERTSMTAAPAAVKKDITVRFYDPDTLDAERFIAENSGKNILVVGHSNTTPALVNSLVGEEKFASMDDGDNGSLFIVQVGDDRRTAIRLKFNCNCPD